MKSYIVMTRIEPDGEKVRLRSTIFAIDGRHEAWRFQRRKTIKANNWEQKSRIWHETREQDVVELCGQSGDDFP